MNTRDNSTRDPMDTHRPDYGPEIDDEPGDIEGLDSLSDHDDDLLRQFSLRMDGRLTEDEELRLTAILDADEAALKIERDLLHGRSLLRELSDPPIPEGLLERTLSRVARTERRPTQDGRVLVLARGLALAAAILLMGSLFAYSNRTDQVGAAPPSEATIEDQLDHGLLDYLRQRFLGRSDRSAHEPGPQDHPGSGYSTDQGSPSDEDRP